MARGPDMRFDIDALFAHLCGKLGEETLAERQWNFCLRSDDVSRLEAVADGLADEFQLEVPEMIDIGSDGVETPGRPALLVVRIGRLGPDEVRAIAARVSAVADQEGLEYEGVDCHEPVDWEALDAWLELDDAAWRMRCITDTGVDEGDPMGWQFAFTGDEVALRGFPGVAGRGEDEAAVSLDERDETWTLVLSRPATNDEMAFRKEYARLEALSGELGLRMLGAQFFDTRV